MFLGPDFFSLFLYSFFFTKRCIAFTLVLNIFTQTERSSSIGSVSLGMHAPPELDPHIQHML